MNVAVFGWYHHRNAGDDRIQACLTRWLDGHTLAFLPAGRPPPVELLRTYDAAILGGGGLLHRRGGVFRNMVRWVRAAGIPAALAGVSLEGEDEDLKSELREFLDVCAFAWFRDRGSLEALGEHPRAFVAPDVTWLYPYEAAGAGTTESAAVCLHKCAGLAAGRWRDALAAAGTRFEPWPLYFEGGGDTRVLGEVFGRDALPAELTLEPTRRAGAVVSSRYHGLVFGLQLGRPVFALEGSPKVRRFVTEQGLGAWSVARDRPEDFPERWRAFWRQRRELTERAAALRSRLHTEVWEKTAPARDRLLAEAAERPAAGRWGRRLKRLWRGY